MAKSSKKRLTQDQEFQIMKLVLDKCLWLGFAIMAYGMVVLLLGGWDDLVKATTFFIAGAVVLLIFMILIVKEYEIIK